MNVEVSGGVVERFETEEGERKLRDSVVHVRHIWKTELLFSDRILLIPSFCIIQPSFVEPLLPQRGSK